jgi:hypothetical protein
MNSTVDWTEVSAAAEDVFRVWRSESSKELDWANTAWIALGRAGFTKYSNAVEKTLVLVRFLTVGIMFREFCELAREETFELDASEWANALEISPVRVGQALGSDSLKDFEDSLDLETALSYLIDQNRSEVFSVLVKAFGTESSLFASLWKASDGAEIEEPEEDVYRILNETSPNKMRAFEWITEGMPAIH